MTSMNKKEFHTYDAVLTSICIVLVVESVVPVATIGSFQYIWWAILLTMFFLPYNMIVAELGTTYDDEGGLYDWVKRAFGRRIGARTAWYYWVNFPIWIVSLSVMFTSVFTESTGIKLHWIARFIVQLIFIWFVIFASHFRVSRSKALINSGALIKISLVLLMGGLGIYGAISRGIVSSDTNVTVSPLQGISFVPVILFSFMGSEAVPAFSHDMKNPKKEIPKVIMISGILITAFYLFESIGVSVAISANELTMDAGFIESVALLTNSPQSILVIIVGMLFMYTLIANLIAWSFGVNHVVMYAARDHAMAAVFKKKNKYDVPSSSNVLNGIIATAIISIATLIEQLYPDVLNIFWTLFALNVVTFLGAYVFLFPTFLKLRKIDPDRRRPYAVPGNKIVIYIVALAPLVLLLMTMSFSMFFYNANTGMLEPNWAQITGMAIAIMIGEIVAARSAARAKKLGLPNVERMNIGVKNKDKNST